MDELVSITEKTLLQQCLLQADDYILVGVSGGPDSMALLGVLDILSAKIGFSLAAAHIHHGLREEADQDLELVRSWCHEKGVKLFEKQLDLRAEAASLSMSLEEAGRTVRREFFAKCRASIQQETEGSVYVALAHHRRDQAETLIFNLSRGSGLSGLAGMKNRDGYYIRPFLKIDSTVILKWLDQNNIPWRNDHTNFETIYTRNRIRHILLPSWQETIGYDPVPLIVRASDNLAMDDDCLEKIATSVFAQVYNEEDRSLSCELLTKEHTAIQMRVLKSFFLRISGTVKDLSQIHLALMQEVLQKQAGPYDLPYGLSIRNYQGRILLEKKDITSSDNESDDWEIQLNIPGTTVLPSGLGSIEAVKIEYDRDFRYNSEMNCFSQGLPAGCVVRLRRPGDHIKPAGRQGTRTLKKFMNEEKIDPKLRNHLPVIANGSDIVWLPEHACGDAYICKIDDIDHSAIRLIWQR